jgi:hypothetical protein
VKIVFSGRLGVIPAGRTVLQRAEHRRGGGDGATGESYTIARHLVTVDRERRIMIASQWCLDRFVMIGGSWFFEERKLILDWSETSQSVP